MRVDQMLREEAGAGAQAQAALHRGRSADGRRARVRGRAHLQPVAVQPRDQRPPPARLGVQAVRLPRGVRDGRRRGPHRPHAGHDRRRLADDVHLRRRGVDAGQLRRRIRRADHAAPRAGDVAQRRDGQGRRDGRATPTIAALWKQVGASTQPRAYPSIALGVFEATPWEIAQAYMVFPNLGELTPLNTHRARSSPTAATSRCRRPRPAKRIARADTTFLVLNMMRSVINEGTGAGRARRRVHAGRRRQVGHDQRPPRRLVRRVHAGAAHGGVGRLRRQPRRGPQRLAGGAAHLDRVHAARARRPPRTCSSRRPGQVVFVDIDRDTGELAGPACPRVFRESFVRRHRAAPHAPCALAQAPDLARRPTLRATASEPGAPGRATVLAILVVVDTLYLRSFPATTRGPR